MDDRIQKFGNEYLEIETTKFNDGFNDFYKIEILKQKYRNEEFNRSIHNVVFNGIEFVSSGSPSFELSGCTSQSGSCSGSVSVVPTMPLFFTRGRYTTCDHDTFLVPGELFNQFKLAILEYNIVAKNNET